MKVPDDTSGMVLDRSCRLAFVVGRKLAFGYATD
jgi:hypothetical protein